ncbi:hypothetical protein [Phytoactinopolyspora endophytica]|nr:hypothetical protein [Phytoactinopolyspora endophytica]
MSRPDATRGYIAAYAYSNTQVPAPPLRRASCVFPRTHIPMIIND